MNSQRFPSINRPIYCIFHKNNSDFKIDVFAHSVPTRRLTSSGTTSFFCHFKNVVTILQW